MRRSLVLLAWAFLLLLVSAAPLGATAPLRVAYTSYPPFFWCDECGAMHGFFYDIITEALDKRMGVPLVWECYPWQRCQTLVREGRMDAMLTVPTAERLVYTVTHRKPFYIKPVVLFTYVGHPRMAEIRAIKSIQDIKKGGFSMITYSGNGWNKKMVESAGIPTLKTPNLKSVWQMLAARRGDLTLAWPVSAWQGIENVGAEYDVVQMDRVILTCPFRLLLRKGCSHTDILDTFDKVIQDMRHDGTMGRILKAYGIPH